MGSQIGAYASCKTMLLLMVLLFGLVSLRVSAHDVAPVAAVASVPSFSVSLDERLTQTVTPWFDSLTQGMAQFKQMLDQLQAWISDLGWEAAQVVMDHIVQAAFRLFQSLLQDAQRELTPTVTI